METSGGNQASLAGRYATALFGLARDERQIDTVVRGLDALDQALLDSREFAEFVESPLIGREQAAKTLAALAAEFGLDPITTKFVGVLAKNGRKRELRKIIRAFKRIAAEHRGETIAEIVTARPLNDDQVAALKAQLRTRAGGGRHPRSGGRSRHPRRTRRQAGQPAHRRLDPHQTQPARCRDERLSYNDGHPRR